MLFIATGVGDALFTAVKGRHDPVPSAETVVTARALAFGFLFGRTSAAVPEVSLIRTAAGACPCRASRSQVTSARIFTRRSLHRWRHERIVLMARTGALMPSGR